MKTAHLVMSTTPGLVARMAEHTSVSRRFPPLPPGWAPAASQHAAPNKVKLPPFWTPDSRSWFALAESTFNPSSIADTRYALTWSCQLSRRR